MFLCVSNFNMQAAFQVTRKYLSTAWNITREKHPQLQLESFICSKTMKEITIDIDYQKGIQYC